MALSLPSFFQMSCNLSWALLCPPGCPLGLSIFMAQLESNQVLFCACSLWAARLNIFFLVGLGLRAPRWPTPGAACALLFVWGFVLLSHDLLLPQCLAMPVQRLYRLCNIFQSLVWALGWLIAVG